MYDTVCVDVEGYFDLRNTPSCRSDTIQFELTQSFVVSSQRSFTLYNVDVYCCLVVFCCGEDLFFVCRDCCVSVDQFCRNAAQSFDTQRQRCYVQQQDGACAFVTGHFTALNCSTYSYTFVGVDTFERFFACVFFHSILYSGDSCGTTNQQNFVDFACGQACIRQSLFYGAHCSVYQIVCQFVKFCSCQSYIQMLGTILIHCDEGQVDVCGSYCRQFFFRFFRSFFQSLHCHFVFGQIHAFCFSEFFYQEVDHSLVEVVTAQVCITVCCQYFDYAVTDFDDGNVECTAAQVVYHDFLFIFVIQTVSQRCRCGFVDDTFYIQTGDSACVFCCLSLRVIEVSRYCDNCFGNCFAQISFCVCFQFLQDHCRDFLRGVTFAFNVYFVVFAHVAFDGSDCVVGVCDRLTFCCFTNQSFAIFCKTYYGRSCSCAVAVYDNNGLTAFHYCYTRVRCTQVDTDNFTHDKFLLKLNPI